MSEITLTCLFDDAVPSAGMDHPAARSASHLGFWGAHTRGVPSRGGGWAPYVFVIFSVAACAGIRGALVPILPDDHASFSIFLLAVLGSAWFGGMRQGLFATSLSVVFGLMFFVSPGSRLPASGEAAVTAAIFAIEGIAISLVAGSLREAIDQVFVRSRQQAALAAIAGVALDDISSEGVAREAVDQLGRAFEGDVACWLRQDDGSFKLAVSTLGGAWQPGRLALSEVPPLAGPISGSILGPVLPRSSARGVAVPVPGRGGPLGVLAVDSGRHGLSGNDREFLETVASFLGTALQKLREEESLHQSEERLRRSHDAANMGTWEWDVASGRVTWSEGLEALHGLSPGSFAGTFEAWIGDIHPDDRERVITSVEQAMQTGHHDVQYRTVLPDGSSRWLAARGQVVKAADGSPVKGVGICMDITGQRAAGESLRVSEERLRLAQEAVGLGTWELDIETGRTFWSEESERIHGLEPGSFGGTLAASTAQVHPDDLARLREGAPGLGEEGAQSAEYRIVRPDGSERWVAAFARRVGEWRVVGVHLDLTERHAAEANLRESEGRFREMANAAPTLIWTAAADGSATFFNDQWLAFTGRSMPEELGEGWLADVHPDDLAEYRSTYQHAMATRESFEIEFRLRRHGTSDYSWLLARGNPVFHQGGRFGGFVGSCIDISERRRTSEAMRLLADVSAELATSLEPGPTLDALTRILVPQFADWCAVDLAEPDGTVRRGSAWHRDPECRVLLDELGTYSAQRIEDPEFAARVIGTGEPAFVPNVTDDQLRAWAHDEHHLEVLRKLEFGSAMAVPLVARGRTLGALALGRATASVHYDRADLELALEVARRAALAIDNAELYLESQRREAGIRRANDALQFLADAGIELSRSLDQQETLSSVARLAVPGFADICFVDVAEPDGTLRRVALSAATPELEERARRLQHDPQGGSVAGKVLVERLRRGESVVMSDMGAVRLEAYSRSPRHLQALQGLEARSLMIVPLIARGHALGAISFVRTRENASYDQNDRAVAEQLGRRAALSLDNSRLYSEARRIEADLRHSNEVIRFVADASAEMADKLDYEESLRKLADLAVPRFADWCAIDILEPGGELKRVAIVHKDPEMVDLAKELATLYPIDMSANQGVPRLLRTGESLLFPEIPEEMLLVAARDEEHRRLIQRLGLKSAMAVALASRGRIFGSLTFVISEGSHRYDQADLAMAEELARRVGVAVENARLYTEGQQREKELVRANEAKDEFLGLMSHELRTPITVIHGGARVLRSRGGTLDDETRDEMLTDMERESERLVRMLENLLALARVELDQEPSVEPVLVQRLVDRIVDASKRADGYHRLEVVTEPHLPTVAAEPGYLEHVVRNLISNAEKYSPRDQPIEIRLSREDDFVALRVMDRGFGIGPEEAERIFERFYRSDRTAKLAGGAGMGLAVCKRLIETMGGHIWAVPRDGGGLEVGFSLPLYEEDQE